MTSNQAGSETQDPREARRQAYQRYLEVEAVDHVDRDHEFEPATEFDDNDVEGHMPGCVRC